jgi:hypothetical protein
MELSNGIFENKFCSLKVLVFPFLVKNPVQKYAKKVDYQVILLSREGKDNTLLWKQKEAAPEDNIPKAAL